MPIPVALESRSPLQTQRESPRTTFLAVLLISLAVLIPCFWQTRIQAGDLGSHIYNAWLATQIKQGKLPGLWIARESTNVLFDVSLAWLLGHLGAGAAQRVAVSASLMIFFWGAFAFISVVTRRRPWFVVPMVAMLAYGYVFHMGFFNFYISLGLCFWWLAIFWKSTSWRLVLSFPLLGLSWLAHALPVIWTVCIAAYILVARRLSPRGRLLLLASALVLLVAFRLALLHLVQANWYPFQLFTVTGADQVFLFDKKYVVPLGGLLLVWAALYRSLRRTTADQTPSASLVSHLVALNALGFLILPERLKFGPYAHGLVYISERMSLATAVLIVALLGMVAAKRWHAAAAALVAAIFFSFLFVDGRNANRFEDHLSAIVAKIPPNQRVVFVYRTPATRIDLLSHMVDRACVGHCFSYANYEAATRQFRVRARDRNPYVVSRIADAYDIQIGTYITQTRDLPLFAITSCNPTSRDYCVRSLRAGEVVDPFKINPVW